MEQFIINQNITSKESKSIEFKKIPDDKDGITYIKQVIPKYMSAFLNTTDMDGGSIYFGILDNGQIEGFSFSQNQNEDTLKLAIDDKAKNKILPSVAPHFYSIHVHPIHNKDKETIPNLFIIEIKVKRDYHNIYFYENNKVVIKTHSQVREFSGLELVEFIKRRKEIIYSQNPINNLYDLFKTLNMIKPLLYWTNEEIPQIHSQYYLDALQQFFYGKNELTSELDSNLLQGLDNLLRIAYAYPTINGYMYEKFNFAAKCFYSYTRLINDLEKYNELEIRFHYLRGDIHYFLSTNQDSIKYEERLVIELAIKTLEYYRVQKHFYKPNTIFKKPLTKIPIEINQTVTKLLLPLIEDKIGVKCDEDIKYIKDLCKNNGQNLGL